MRRGFTLIEMLIAMALTLILVYSVAEFYAYVGNIVRDGRATIELGGQLRAATQQLQDDLRSMTLRPQPWIDSGSSPGYFTVYEGPSSDQRPDNGWTDLLQNNDAATGNLIPDLIQGTGIASDGTTPVAQTGATTLIGDGDDVISFTIQAVKQPFQGSAWDGTQYSPITSEFAEVVWYTTFDDVDGDDVWDIDEPRFVCRRLLLIVPGLGNLQMPNNNLTQFKQNAEVSFHLNNSGNPVANSLADLSFRHNRFGCQLQNPTYPSHLRWNPTRASTLTNYTFQGTKFGEDRVLSNVLAFDVRVYDPSAPVYRSSNSNETTVGPGDPGFGTAQGGNANTNNTNLVSLGTWVDLSYNRTLPAGSGSSLFSGVPSNNFNLTAPSASPWIPYNFHIWDTWPLAYELSNVGGSPGTGQAFNGLDDTVSGAATNGVDDAGERQTAPPYSAPLRGIQVRLRAYEVQTRQARQVTVTADFLQE